MILVGKGFGRHTGVTAGICSHGTRRQVRIDILGWFVAVVARRKEAR